MSRGPLLLVVLVTWESVACARVGFAPWPCEGVSCGGHGTCGVTASGEPLCACAPGYRNAGPQACARDPYSVVDPTVDAAVLDALAPVDAACDGEGMADRVLADAAPTDTTAPDQRSPEAGPTDAPASDVAPPDTAVDATPDASRSDLARLDSSTPDSASPDLGAMPDRLLLDLGSWDQHREDGGVAWPPCGDGVCNTEVALFFNPSAGPNDRFGKSVSVRGDVVAAGAYYEDVAGKPKIGAAHVYRLVAGAWRYDAHLVPPDLDSLSSDHKFGRSLSLSRDNRTLLVGAYGGNRAYFFEDRSGAGDWQHLQTVTPSRGNFFGEMVAVDQEIAVVGDYGQARFYAYTYDGRQWTGGVALPPAPDRCGMLSGSSLAVSSLTIAAGSLDCPVDGLLRAGKVFVSAYDGATWTTRHLQASIPAAEATFGMHLALDGDHLLVSAVDRESCNPSCLGEAFYFERSGGAWLERQRIKAPAGASGFGAKVALAGDTALIPGVDAAGNGAVWRYALIAGQWQLQEMLAQPPLIAGDHGMGTALAVDGTRAVVASTARPTTENWAQEFPGAVYVFELGE